MKKIILGLFIATTIFGSSLNGKETAGLTPVNIECPIFDWEFAEDLLESGDSDWILHDLGYFYNADRNNKMIINQILEQKNKNLTSKWWEISVDESKKPEKEEGNKCYYKVTTEKKEKLIGTFTVNYVRSVEELKKSREKSQPKL